MFGREPRTFISMSLPEVNYGQTPDVRAQIAEVVQRLHLLMRTPGKIWRNIERL